MSQLDNITVKQQPAHKPQFDRGIKPNSISDYNQNIQRDFAPVYGCPVSLFYFDKKKINQLKLHTNQKNVCKRDSKFFNTLKGNPNEF